MAGGRRVVQNCFQVVPISFTLPAEGASIPGQRYSSSFAMNGYLGNPGQKNSLLVTNRFQPIQKREKLAIFKFARSATFLRRTTTSKRLFESSRLGEFECEISTGQDLRQKKLLLSITPARRPSEHTSLGPPPKGVNCNFSWPEFDRSYGVIKLSISDA